MLVGNVTACLLLGTGCRQEPFGDQTVSISTSIPESSIVGGQAGPEDDVARQRIYRMTAGQKTLAAQQTVPSSGGRLLVSAPGEPGDGLTVDVPAGAYDRSVEFEVWTAPVVSFDGPVDLTPVTPLFSIENGGEYAQDLMTLTIPARVSDGHFAMPFFYDPESGELDGLPVVARDDRTITTVTRHFSKVMVLERSLSEPKDRIDSSFEIGKDTLKVANEKRPKEIDYERTFSDPDPMDASPLFKE